MDSNINKIQHIAFIMDGNGRWAKAHGLPRHLGHKAGCDAITEISDECLAMGVKAFSLYAFSTENWNRPKDEINHLFNYLVLYFKAKINKIMKDNVKVIVSGDISKLPAKAKKTVEEAIEKTKNNTRCTVNICLNYGGKQEILRATKMIAEQVKENKLSLDQINEDVFNSCLYTSELPPVDLLIRTSGEQRTSNFLPWQIAYAEFVFTPVYWPDFNKIELRKCVDEYYKRHRRYGGLDHDKES